MNEPTTTNPAITRCPTCGRPDLLTWTLVADLIDDAMEVAREDLLDEAHRNRRVVITNRVMAFYRALNTEEMT